MLDNARTLANTLKAGGLDIVSGGTDCHLVLVDLRPKNITGRDAELSLERARMTCNNNAIPFDPQKPMVTSGIRVGSPAATTRGFGVAEFETIGHYMVEVLDGLARNGLDGNAAVEADVAQRVLELCEKFPIYPRQ